MAIFRTSLICFWAIVAAELVCLSLSLLMDDLPPGIVNFAYAAKFSLPLVLLLTVIYWHEKRRRLRSDTAKKRW